MALHADTVWEIRTTGANTNGGGFYNRDPGTSVDYSQQDAAQLSLSDIATDAAGTTLTSATGGFTAAMAGNIIYLTGGGATAGWYEIIAYTDTNTVTIDRSAGANKTSVTGNVGGAFKIGGSLDGDFFVANTAKVAGNTVHIKTGTYTAGESITIGPQINIIGYNSTRNDRPTAGDRPTIDMTASYFISTSGNCNISDMIITGAYTGVAGVLTASGGAGIFFNCKFENTSSSANDEAVRNNSSNTFIGCEFKSALGYAIRTSGDGGRFLFCYIHDSAVGVYLNADIELMVGCVIDTCTIGIDGVNPGNNEAIHIFLNNTVYNCTTGIYTDTSSEVLTQVIINNIIDGCTTGLDAQGTATLPNFMDFNCWNNTTDINGSQFSVGSNSVENDPEMSAPASADFTLGADSPAADEAMDAATYTDATV